MIIYRLSAYYGNLLGLSFEKASALSSRFQSGLEKCCLQPQPECIIEEVRGMVRPLWFHSMLCSTNQNKERRGSDLSWDNSFDQCSFWQCIFLFQFARHLMIWEIKRFGGVTDENMPTTGRRNTHCFLIDRDFLTFFFLFFYSVPLLYKYLGLSWVKTAFLFVLLNNTSSCIMLFTKAAAPHQFNFIIIISFNFRVNYI